MSDTNTTYKAIITNVDGVKSVYTFTTAEARNTFVRELRFRQLFN